MYLDSFVMLGLIAAWYVTASLIAFFVYAVDKSAARRNEWRIPERTLHLLALAGGWPGGMLAQKILRHKSRKPVFHFVLWTSALLHLAVLAWLAFLR